MNTPNDILNKPKQNNKSKKGPQKNNLFGVSDDEIDESKGRSPQKMKSGLKSDQKNNVILILNVIDFLVKYCKMV